MSNDKRKSLKRRMRLLMKAKTSPIQCNVQGGISSENPDLLRLEADGHLEKVRHVRRHGSPHQGPITVTSFKITLSGEIFYDRYKDVLLSAEQKKERADAAFETRIMTNFGTMSRRTKKAQRASMLRSKQDRATRSAQVGRMRHEAFKNAPEGVTERYIVETDWMPREDLVRTPTGSLFASATGFVHQEVKNLFPSETLVPCEHSLTEVFTMLAPVPTKDLPEDSKRPEHSNFKLLSMCRPDGGALFSLYRKPIHYKGTTEWGYEEVDMTREVYRLVFEATDPTIATFLMFQFRGMTPYTTF